MARISASILSADLGRLAEEVARVESAGVDLLHLDIMDGHFVPNLSFGPALMGSIRRVSSLPMHAHLMVNDPTWMIDECVAHGAQFVTVHAEACAHLHRTLSRIRESGISPGVALNPATPLTNIEWVLTLVDNVTLMSVNPGFGGQKFISSVLAKISALCELAARLNPALDIIVDGGINDLTARAVVEAGASTLVVGSYLFGQNTCSRVQTIRQAIRHEVSC